MIPLVAYIGRLVGRIAVAKNEIILGQNSPVGVMLRECLVAFAIALINDRQSNTATGIALVMNGRHVYLV